MSWNPKDPDEVLDYGLDWGANRLDAGDTILSSEWFISSALTPDNTPEDPVTLVIDSNEHTTTETKVWLSGGLLGATYKLTNRVETAGGRTLDWTEKLRVKAK